MPRVLVVEDEVAIAEELIDRLEGLGFEVPGTATSGEDAIRKTEAMQPDLVLMDINLDGEMDGIEAAELIHEKYDIPLIYLTAYSNRETLERAKNTEPFGYIVKPFEDRDIMIAVDLALHKHKKEKELREWLLRAREELKSVDMVKESIIDNVSHELRTPIQIAVGAIELASIDDDAQLHQKHLGMAKDALMRQDRIVEDLIQLTNLRKMGPKLKKEDVKLDALVDDAVGVVEKEACDKEITIEVDVPGVSVRADPKLLKHALLNILDNAVKFTGDGGSVVVKAENLPDVVEITVEDTGTGIPGEYHNKIFDTLFQIDPSSTRKFGGTGSGLAVAKYVIELHDGRIWAWSEGAGKGSIFHVELPKNGRGPVFTR